MASNGSEKLKKAPNGPKWLQNYFKWFEMALNGSKWLQMAPNGSKWFHNWLQMAPIGSEWHQMALNSHK